MDRLSWGERFAWIAVLATIGLIFISLPRARAEEACRPAEAVVAGAARNGIQLMRVQDGQSVSMLSAYFNSSEPVSFDYHNLAYLGHLPNGQVVILLGRDGSICSQMNSTGEGIERFATQFLGTRS